MLHLLDEAAEQFEKALEKEPKSAKVKNILGVVYKRQVRKRKERKRRTRRDR
jgi:Flp pilus assembly protein TadD